MRITLTRKTRNLLLLIPLSLFIWGVKNAFEVPNEMETESKTFAIEAPKSDLIFSETRGYDHVEVYQLSDHKVIINIYSDHFADIPEQYEVNTHEKVSKNNVELTWRYAGSDDYSIAAVHVRMMVGDEVLFDKESSFIEKAVEAVIESVNNNGSSN